MTDFKRIIDSGNKLYNFHSHTQFCDGRDVMENFVIKAIDAGFTDYGFSPHSPVPVDSPCNMDINNVPAYISEVNRLKDKYGDKINLYASMEVDYLGDLFNTKNELFDKINLDYIIGSVHFIPSDQNIYVDIDGSYETFAKKMHVHFHDDVRWVVEKYYSQAVNMIELGGFDIIGHCDKIGDNANSVCNGIENEDWYQKLVKNEFEAIMDNHLIIEINTKAYDSKGRFFPNERYFKQLKKYNAPLLINSDAHYPELVNAGRMEAFRILESF